MGETIVMSQAVGRGLNDRSVKRMSAGRERPPIATSRWAEPGGKSA